MADPTKNVPGSEISVYRLTEIIGKGGFSEVWSAWDKRLQRLVAVKIIARGPSDAYNTIQFGREASLVSRLEHPHILPLYDYGEVPDYRYLVMRYVTGGSLANRLERKPLLVGEVIKLLTPIAAALDYIHEQRVVHRDLKPGNILLDAQDAPYLTDFGLAKQLTDETRPIHSASGTLTYMPPEQFSGGSMSVQSDMYSFGILLFQLLAGELPFEGKVALGMRQLNRPEQLPDITMVQPHLPARLNEFLWQLTATEPEARPASAVRVMESVAEILEEVTQDRTTTRPLTITVALESKEYHEREAESLLEQDLVPWRTGQFSLRLTHFVLLDVLLRNLPALITNEVRALMLRGAFENHQQIDYWWENCGDSVRREACWHAIRHGNDAVCLEALSLLHQTHWAVQASNADIQTIGRRLLPLSNFTPIVMGLLQRALPAQREWLPGNDLQAVDEALAQLAVSNSPLAGQAATLIGSAHRTHAALRLPTTLNQASPILIVLEVAGSLPSEISRPARLRLLIRLALRQLARQPLEALGQYGWASAGSSLALGLLIYVAFRSADLLGSYRLLNTLGNGLLFGVIYAIGLWLSRHITQRLQIVPFTVRAGLGIVVGGAALAVGFTLFHQLVLNGSEIESWVALSSGLLYVAGFTVSIGWPLWIQFLCGLAGVAVAFLWPWFNYVNYDITPPFIFDAFDAEGATALAVALTVAYGVILSGLTLGYRWVPDIWSRIVRRQRSFQDGQLLQPKQANQNTDSVSSSQSSVTGETHPSHPVDPA